MGTIGDLADNILEAFSEFQDIQYYQNEQRDKQIKKIIEETRRNMLIILIITFLFTILLSLVMPGKIALLHLKRLMMPLESYRIVTLTSQFTTIKMMRLVSSQKKLIK